MNNYPKPLRNCSNIGPVVCSCSGKVWTSRTSWPRC